MTGALGVRLAGGCTVLLLLSVGVSCANSATPLPAERSGPSFSQGTSAAWQDEFSQLAATLESSFPETYAGEVLDQASGMGTISFVGDVPTQAAELVPPQHRAKVQFADGMPYSVKILKRELEVVYQEILATEGVQNVGGHYAIASGELRYDIELAKGVTPDNGQRIRALFDGRKTQAGPIVNAELVESGGSVEKK